MPIELTINGKQRTLEGETNLLAFLEANGISNMTIAVEYNGEILRREQFGEIALRTGDKLEIVRAIGGGQHREAGPPSTRTANVRAGS